MAKIYESLAEFNQAVGAQTPAPNIEERFFRPEFFTDFEKLGKYDTDLYPGMNQEYHRGENQRGWGLVPTAAGRLVASTVLKTLEGFASLTNPLEGNALTREIAETEKHFLEEVLPVYRTPGMDSDLLSDKLREGGWWASTAIDGAAFMLSAILGAKGINAISKLASVGRIAKALGASNDVLKSIGKVQRSNIGRLLSLEKPGVNLATGYNAYTESSFEARHSFEDIRKQLSSELYGTEYNYLNDAQKAEVDKTAGTAAKDIFWHNLPMLLVTEKIFNETIIGDFFGMPSSSAMGRMAVENAEVTVKNLTKAQKAALIGLPIGVNIASESMQENYQLAVQNYFTKDALGKPVTGIMEEMANNFRTGEGLESMFLGGFLGGLGGAFGSIKNYSKEQKAAEEYARVLNQGYNNLTKSGTRLFQTNEDGTIKIDPISKKPVPKTREELNQEYEALSNDFDKYLYSNVINMMAKEGDLSAQEIANLDKDNSFADFILPFFDMEGGTELANKLLETYADKIAKEYPEELKEKGTTAATILKDLKGKMKEMESLFHLSKDYYALPEYKESNSVQYKSLFKQEYYKKKIKELNETLGSYSSALPTEAMEEINDFINGKIKVEEGEENKAINKLADKVDETKLPTGENANTLANNIAKAFSYKSLFEAEKDLFKSFYTKPEWYANIREQNRKEQDAKTAKATEEAEKAARLEKIKAEEASKKAEAKPKTEAKPGTTPEVKPEGMPGIQVTPADEATPQTTAQTAEATAQPVAETKPVSQQILDSLKEKPKQAATIARELGLPANEVKQTLAELAMEGKVIAPEGKKRLYTIGNVTEEEGPKYYNTAINNVRFGLPITEEDKNYLLSQGIIEEVNGKLKFVQDPDKLTEANLLANQKHQHDLINLGAMLQVNDLGEMTREEAREKMEEAIEAIEENNKYFIDAITALENEEEAAELEFDTPPSEPTKSEVDGFLNNLQDDINKNNEVSIYTLVTEAVRVGFNKIANRVVGMLKIFNESEVSRETTEDASKMEDAITAYMSTKVKRGTKLTFRIPKDYKEIPTYTDNTFTATVPFSEKLKNIDDPEVYLEEVTNNVPIAIYDGDVLLGYVHRVDYIDTTNLQAQDEEQIIAQRKKLIEFRQKFINEDGSVNTELEITSKVISKSNGKLNKGGLEQSLSLAVPNQTLAYIDNNRLVVGKGISKGKVKNLGNFPPGTAGIIVKDNSGTMYFLPARRKKLTAAEKESIKQDVLSKDRKLSNISNKIYVITSNNPETIKQYGKTFKTPHNLVLAVFKDGFAIYDKRANLLYQIKDANNAESVKSVMGKLDEYFAQELVANANFKDASEENVGWMKDHLTTNVQEIEVEHGGDIEHTVFVHNVVRYDMPASSGTKPASKQETTATTEEGLNAEIEKIEAKRKEELLGIRFKEKGTESAHLGSKTFEAELKRMIIVSKAECQTNINEDYLKSLIREIHKDSKLTKDKINAKYDAELAALKKPATETKEEKKGKEINNKRRPSALTTKVEPSKEAKDLTDNCNVVGKEKPSNKRIPPPFKAKLGLVTGAGTTWSLVKEFKGPSHAQGGIDIKLDANGYGFMREGKEIKAKYGLVVEV